MVINNSKNIYQKASTGGHGEWKGCGGCKKTTVARFE